MDLANLFKNVSHKCEGCSILSKPIGKHSIMDYECEPERDVLFMSDSLKLFDGDYVAFRSNEWSLIMREVRKTGYADKIGFTSSVKCPSIKKDDMSAKNRKICRQHVEDTIKQYKPKVVFACGSLATMMLYGKNVDSVKIRGIPVDMEMGGHSFKVVSIFHPYQVIAEPKNAYLFSLDIVNNINKEILKQEVKSGFAFEQIFSLEDLEKVRSKFLDTEDPVAIDIETTGLSFLDDTIHTVAMSVIGDTQTTIAIPIDHPANKQGLYFKAKVFDFISEVMANKKNRKILQNAKFDLKFLRRYGVKEVHNIYDTKLMQHCYNEDVPKSLRDLVNYYFPNETI